MSEGYSVSNLPDQMPEIKVWEPVEDLEIMAVDSSGFPCDENSYSTTVIGFNLSDPGGYSVMEVCTGMGKVFDMELANLVLSALKK